MTSELLGVCFDAQDPMRVAEFWSGVLQRELVDGLTGAPTLAPGDSGFHLRFAPTEAPKMLQNRVHFDLTSETWEQQAETVERALALGGRHVDIGQDPDELHVVLADPEGNEFCVIEPGNTFLAGCGFIGGVNCDGTQQLGYFWSLALEWPLVWDQDEETAIQSPRGGSKFTWSGPPLMPQVGKNRQQLDLICAETQVDAEVERLVSLGATSSPGTQAREDEVPLVDPDGNGFSLFPVSR